MTRRRGLATTTQVDIVPLITRKGTPICTLLCFAVYYSLTSFSLGYYKLLRLLSDSYQVLGDRGSN